MYVECIYHWNAKYQSFSFYTESLQNPTDRKLVIETKNFPNSRDFFESSNFTMVHTYPVATLASSHYDW